MKQFDLGQDMRILGYIPTFLTRSLILFSHYCIASQNTKHNYSQKWETHQNNIFIKIMHDQGSVIPGLELGDQPRIEFSETKTWVTMFRPRPISERYQSQWQDQDLE